MPRQSIDDQIRTRIDLFVEELSSLVREAAIEAVGEALQDGSGASRRSTAPGAKTARRKPARGKASGRKAARKAGSAKKRVRRSSEEIAEMGERVLAYVKTNPGARMEQIAKALRKQTKDLRRSVQELTTSKKLRTKGQKRATEYYAGAARTTARKTGPRRVGGKRKKKTTRTKAKSAA